MKDDRRQRLPRSKEMIDESKSPPIFKLLFVMVGIVFLAAIINQTAPIIAQQPRPTATNVWPWSPILHEKRFEYEVYLPIIEFNDPNIH